MQGQQTIFLEKKQKSEELIFMYLKLLELQQSWLKQCFRFQHSQIFKNIERRYSIPGVINVRLDDIIYMLILLCITVLFCILPSQNQHTLTKAFQHFNVMLLACSGIWLLTNHLFKHLIFLLLLIIFPFLALALYLNVFSTENTQASNQIYNYLGYFSFWFVFVALYLTYPLKQFIRNQIGTIYSYLFAISFLVLFLIWPAYSLLQEYVANSVLTLSFITNNKPLIMSFIVIITLSFHLLTHNTFFQGNLEKVQKILKYDFSQQELVTIRRGNVSDFKEITYENFSCLTRFMSITIFVLTLACQIFLFNYLSSNVSQIWQCLIQMVFFIGFNAYGCIINRLTFKKPLIITLSCILSLVPMVFSPFYYFLSFENYIFIVVALPYSNIFWCIARSVSLNSPIFKMKVVTVMFFLVHIPVSIFIMNSYGLFSQQSSIISISKIIIGGILATIILLLLIVITGWLCLRVSGRSKEVKEDENQKKTIDYNYFEEGNPPYPGYTIKKLYSFDWLTSLDFRNLGLIISSVLFVFCQLATMYTFNQLNNTLINKVFYSDIVREVIYQQFATIVIFYVISQYYISSSPNSTIQLTLGIFLLIVGLFGIIYSYVGSIIPLTFRIVGAFCFILLPIFYGFRVIKNVDTNVAKFVAPMLIITSWFVIILPFVEVIPIVSVYISSQSFGIFIYGSILGSTIIIILVVGGVSLIFNVLMNKFDMEKKIKFITEDVQSFLLDEGIQAPDEILHILYESYDNRDKKYLYFLKKGFPVNVLNKQDSHQLITYDRMNKQEEKIQTQLKVDCCWSCLTFFCGKDDQEIQENIEKVVKKNNVTDEQLMNLLPQNLLKGFFGTNPIIIQERYKKAVDPSKIYSTKSPILKNAHTTRRHLGDDYALLEINHNVNIEIQIWHKIFYFISNEDYQDRQLIFTDFSLFISMTKINLTAVQLNELYSRFSTADWGKIKALNLNDFSILVEHLSQTLYPKSPKQQRRMKLLLQKVFYNLAEYQEFQEEMMKNHNIIIREDELTKSPFLNSMKNYEQNKKQQNKKGERMINRKKKHDSDKLIEPNSPVISKPKEEEVERQKSVSCKRLIYDKYLKMKKCCEKQQKQQEVVKRNRVKPWEYLAVETVRMMQQKQARWSEQHTVSQHKFRISFNNLMIAVLKLLDLYTYLEITIRDSNVGWIQINRQSNLIISYKYQLYLCCAIIIVCLPLGIKGILYILQDKLGLTEARTPAVFPHSMFIFTSIYKLIILSLFTTVATTLLTTFSCSWTSTFTLLQDTSIICFTSQHNIYIIISIIGLIIYYPLSAYTMPNFQFADKILDLKFKPSYLVIYFQVNFVMAAGKVLLRFQDSSSTFQIIFISNNIVMLVLLAISVIYLRPCLIQWFNYIQLLIILIGVFVNCFGLMLYITKLWFLAVCLALGTSSFATIVTIIIIKKRYFSTNDLFQQSPEQLEELEQTWKYKNKVKKEIVSINITF